MTETRRRRTMEVLTAAALSLAALALAACGGLSPRSESAAVGGSGGDDETERTVAIYASVVRQLVEKDHTFGSGEAPFKRLFIVDGVVENAGDPIGGAEDVGPPFSAEVREGLANALRDLLPVEFVRDRDEVTFGPDECGGVRGEGVLITLGPIEGDGERVEVANELWFSCRGGQWLTYVVENEDGVWKVTGTTGPVAIS